MVMRYETAEAEGDPRVETYKAWFSDMWDRSVPAKLGGVGIARKDRPRGQMVHPRAELSAHVEQVVNRRLARRLHGIGDPCLFKNRSCWKRLRL